MGRGHEPPRHPVEQDARAPHERQDHEGDPDEDRVDLEVLSDPAGHTGHDAVVRPPDQLLAGSRLTGRGRRWVLRGHAALWRSIFGVVRLLAHGRNDRGGP